MHTYYTMQCLWAKCYNRHYSARMHHQSMHYETPAEKRASADVGVTENSYKRRKKEATGQKCKMNTPPTPESDTSGFTGDTTTSWDQAAFEEAMKAEESLQQQRWKEIIKDWYGEIKQSGVRGLRSVEDVFKHLERQGKSYQTLAR